MVACTTNFIRICTQSLLISLGVPFKIGSAYHHFKMGRVLSLQCITRQQWILLTYLQDRGGPILSMSLLLECGRNALEVCEFTIVVSQETGILTLNVDLTLSCLMLSRVLILILTSRWHTLGAQMFSQALLRQRVAANRRETRKMAKYEQHKLPGGSVVKVVPLVMEHFGSWGERQENFCRNWQPFHQMKQEDLMLQNF